MTRSNGTLLTIAEYARERGHAHRTVARGVAEANLQPCGSDPRGKPLYRLRDLVAAKRPETDPDKMTGFQRKAHFQAEHARLGVDAGAARLIPADEVAACYAETAAVLDAAYDALPGLLEREAGLTPRQVAVAKVHIAKARAMGHSTLARGRDAAKP